jgi:3(or 17)beta-hydroxysteroid dehydrogenase
MAGRVDGKVCIVTGAAMGLGLADAQALADQGATVILTDVNEEAGRAAADAIGGGAIFQRQDVTSEAGWVDLIGLVRSKFGSLDVLVNNAGIVILGSVEEATEKDWRSVVDVSATSTFLGCKHAIPLMRDSGGGSIINMASSASQIGIGSIVAYAAAKGAIRSMTKSIAVHCADKGYEIRCNSVHPANIETPMLRAAIGDQYEKMAGSADGIGRVGRPEDVANMIVYLASDESAFVSGAEMVIDFTRTIRESVVA